MVTKLKDLDLPAFFTTLTRPRRKTRHVAIARRGHCACFQARRLVLLVGKDVSEQPRIGRWNIVLINDRFRVELSLCVPLSCFRAAQNPVIKQTKNMRRKKNYNEKSSTTGERDSWIFCTLSVPVFCAAWAKDGYVVCGGGGGATRSGRGNMLILARWTGSAMEQLYTRSTGLDAPYHLAIHPNGTDFVCSFIANEWHDGKLEFFRLAEDLSIESAHREIVIAKEQTAMAFSMDGTMFATAGMNGHLRVYKWPSLELLVDEQCEIGSAEFKSLEFSEEGTLLAASTSGGKTYVWELHGDNHLRVIPSEEGRYCWFSRSSTPQLHVASSKGHITNWSEDWRTKETRKERFCTHPFSAFSVSSDGKLLAM
ncbi:SEC12-like protein 2 [Selaginella moellendorffii]|uniref:SEC12-like protein 2 n=1 Tax=Selaginella moellendorffii TaxID=88036 RepID=UPI000D1CDF28|nr:SEC12-like protein 2 [Selaginella moellendorffii]|eukprot:XP_024516770.1 SEC12-like protein 2 [Selaginella moellendorffii]